LNSTMKSVLLTVAFHSDTSGLSLIGNCGRIRQVSGSAGIPRSWRLPGGQFNESSGSVASGGFPKSDQYN